ncbi:hypothetical protein GCM10011514_18210 [Emticicia aquatilis]|uniref:DUF4249 domain-containing protein n=1 Tax=Emticicia aquatilis TaxID=1537369 RepID=A0A917DNF3_9BACT|nr:DUF4249 domain-containing protein [Emticicia aquatilis]GGD54431.1 hypothetical protein GCM10011514_18210 [Emticicia aquatilis]
MKTKIIGFIITIGLWVTACVEPFELGVVSDLRILTVDATLTDIAKEQRVTISESFNAKGTAFNSPILKASVELLINGKETVKFIEKGEGIYALPTNFELKTGTSYQLFFTKNDGSSYKSGIEKLVEVPEIIRIHDVFYKDGILKEEKFIPANFVYIDTKDPAEEKNNYLWTWQLWEKQDICITCEGGRYYPNTGCRAQNEYQGLFFDYYCEGDCWDILRSSELNVLNDFTSNGKTISNRLVAQIPYYTTNGALIEISQQSISNEAYKYLKLLADQTQNTGTLVDTPPAALIGNITNINNTSEPVAGFFMVKSIKSKRYWIDRKEPNELKIKTVGLRDHTLSQEPPVSGEIGRPPLVKCLLSPTRTPNKPDGWLQ